MKSNSNTETDLQLIKRLQAHPDDSSAVDELTSRHSGIYINMVTLYTPASSLSNRNELLAEKAYHIYQAALKYDPHKGAKFSTYLGNETKWMCLNIYNKNKRSPEVIVEDIVLELNQDFRTEEIRENNLDKELFCSIMDAVNRYSDKRISKIFHLRYVEGHKNKVMPWKLVSQELGMSIQGCINIHDSTIKKIKNKLKEV